MMLRRALAGILMIGVVAAGCAPPPTAAATNTIDLGALGKSAEPAFDVSASITEQDNPRGPRTSTLTVIARDSEGNIVDSFVMREDNVYDAVTLPGPGEFPGLLAPPHTRVFTIVRGDVTASTLFGKVTITELQTGEITGAGNGPIYDVTKLRASFTGVFETYGTINGYFTIG